MNFNKINNLVGWAVCIIASATYILTAEANGSLWDCGEFVSSAFKVQIPHPPGAPLFVLIGRFFIVLFGDNPHTAAKAVNIMSALASGATILFLFWTITHFARKALLKAGEELSNGQIIAIMGAGAVGALAYTFSDSFWYSAVEGEVYALSSFFTAIVFWAMLKWEHAVDHEEETGINADRWIVFIFFLMGLSVGVHLLVILTLPAIVVIYYYKRYRPSKYGVLWAFLIGCLITGIVQKAVIQWTIEGAGYFDIFFVNSFGMPFFSGFFIFFILLSVAVWWGLKVARRKGWGFLRITLWCFAFMLIGYSSYMTTMIRSNADPAIDMYNVDNPMSLVGYLSREQYGDFPLLYGQKFTAKVVDYKEGGTKYAKSPTGKYIESGKEFSYVYDPDQMMLFPRVWDASNDQGHAEYYANFLNLRQADGSVDDPTFADNIKFFVGYQMYWMYFRYFMWNFAGKQNDVQGIYPANVRDGNWISGIPFIDNMLYGDQSLMPDSSKNNKAHNTLFLLPLILGIIGLVYQNRVDKRDTFITFLLFFFTGIAIVLYLNQAGNQPRERDYAYVGSFYAFAIWIGLGVLQVREWIAKKMNRSMATNIAIAACLLAVPVLMGAQEWNDHDRSRKTLARDLAKDYLESCPQNAILFSFGDNDTYPLWYAQEVEGIRPDVRVINYSLLGTADYINQLRYKINQSDPIDVIWTPEQIAAGKRDAVQYNDKVTAQNVSYDLYDLLKNYMGSEDENKWRTFPAKKVSVPVDSNVVHQNGTVNADDKVAPKIEFDVKFKGGNNYLYKNDLTILCVVAANQWKRPICFTSPFDEIGFGKYLRKDGMTYRLVPVVNTNPPDAPFMNTNWAKEKMMTQFASGNANVPNVYFDEENRRHLLDIRNAYSELARDLVQKGRKEEARQALEKVDKMMLDENMPYGLISRSNMHDYYSMNFLVACYMAEDKELAAKVSKSVKTDLQQQLRFYNGLGESKKEWMDREIQGTQQLLQQLDNIDKSFTNPAAKQEGGAQSMSTSPAPPPPPAKADGTKKDSAKK